MKRPQQHITDDAGERQMRGIFEPLGWTVNKLAKDYGSDFEVEIFRDFESTGAAFKVQLKSSESTKYSARQDFISQKIKIKNLIYLCRELHVPSVLIHADVCNQRTFWLAPQLLADKIENLDTEDIESERVIRISTINELPNTLEQLVDAVTKAEQLLALKLLLSTPVSDFVSSFKDRVDEIQLIQDLQDKGDALKLNQANTLFKARLLDEAQGIAQKIILNSESSIRSKFLALLVTEKIKHTKIVLTEAPQGLIADSRLDIAIQLQNLTKKGPGHLKFYALIAREAAELEILVRQDYGLFMNWGVHKNSDDHLWKAQLVFERTAVYRQIVLKYNQCLRLVRYAMNSRYRAALPEALLRVTMAISPFILRLSLEQLNEIADRYSASALQVCKLVGWIAASHGDDESLSATIIPALLTKQSVTGEAVEWAKKTISQIKDNKIKKDAEEMFDISIRRYLGEEFDDDVKTTVRQVYENMATALGIDLSDENSPLAEVVRIGIADLDPSRILKICEHLYVTLRMFAPIAFPLDLPTAGHKIVHCVLHEHFVEGLSLNETHSVFKQKYCDKCLDCSPRPDTWEYSPEWQEEENERQAGYMRKFAEKEKP